MDSTLIWPYHIKEYRCLGCKHTYMIRLYGDPLDNLVPVADEMYRVELHIKNCWGERRGS